MDAAREYTDREIRRVARELAVDYGREGELAASKVLGFLTSRTGDDGLVPESALQGRDWARLRSEVARQMSDRNRASAEAIGGRMGTVRDLTAEGAQAESKVPRPAIDRRRDLTWNERHVEAAARASVGKDPEVAARGVRGLADMNRNAAVRKARTAINGAENAGRMDAMLARGGSKRWVAVMDERTRVSHASINGEVVPVDQPFSNGLMYPGDPSGPPEEVYNCRCTMEWVDTSGEAAPDGEVRYGEFRDLSYVDDGLAAHWGDGSDLDPRRMVMEDCGFDEARADLVRRDVSQWVGQGYKPIRSGELPEVEGRLEEFLAASPKYEGTVWRGIGVERSEGEAVLEALRQGGTLDNRGIASWATESDWAAEFMSMNMDEMDDPVGFVFELEENRSGVSIKHLAEIDNDEVVAPKGVLYEMVGEPQLTEDPYDGEYWLVKVREVAR